MVGRNIVAYDSDGNMVWRVEDHGVRVQSERKAPEAFFNIGLKDGNILQAVSLSYIFRLDPETGTLSNPRYRYPGM